MFIDVDIELSQIEQNRLILYIQSEVLRQILERLQQNRTVIEQRLRDKITESWITSLGAHELVFGKLRFDLGLKSDEARQAVYNIASIISKDIYFHPYKSNQETVTVNIGFIKSSYEEILALPEASFIQTYSRNPGSKIDWLEWLLRKGDQYEILDYHVQYVTTAHSRSGGALMIQGGIWRIPPDWSSDHHMGNIIVRSFEGIDKFIAVEIIKVI